MQVIVASELRNKTAVLRSLFSNSNQSKLIWIIPDLAIYNINAKIQLAEEFHDITFLACYAHQLNLLASILLMHDGTKHVILRARALVRCFTTFPKQRATPQQCMRPEYGKTHHFITQAFTRWYSHCGLLISITKLRRSLECYELSITDDNPLGTYSKGVDSLDTISSASFRSKLPLVGNILRPLPSEIGLLERTGTNLSDIMHSFGRLWALPIYKVRK